MVETIEAGAAFAAPKAKATKTDLEKNNIVELATQEWEVIRW